MERLWIKRLEEELTKPLPGKEAQLRLSPPDRGNSEYLPHNAKKSAVLILLYWNDGEFKTVFIKRAEYDGIHSGQVSLPGGVYEHIDGNMRNTALRETREETGLSPDNIRVIGTLTSLHIPVSNYLVYPFVGFCANEPEFHPDPVEVSYLIETGIAELLKPENRKHKIMKIGEGEIEIPYFDIHDNHIWGATAMIISEFLDIVQRIPVST